jgi:hypothetical protein
MDSSENMDSKLNREEIIRQEREESLKMLKAEKLGASL